MSAPVPKGKWAWKHNKCVRCRTKTIRHKGLGLCLHCWDKRRAKNPKRKKQLKASHDRWYLKVKGTKKYKEYTRLKAEEWRHNEKLGYRLCLQRAYLIGNFKRFLNRKRFLKRDLDGIQIRCDGCSKKCLITTPIKKAKKYKMRHKMYELNLFKKILIKNCKKKIKKQ